MSCDWLFVDGSSLIFRAFYGVPKTVRSPDGTLINAGRGFLETLTRLVGTQTAAPHRRRRAMRTGGRTGGLRSSPDTRHNG